MANMQLPADVLAVVTALVAGLVIGLQRGWQAREAGDGERVAGMRTFGLLGMLGAVLSLSDSWLMVAGAMGLALFNAVAYREAVRATGNLSATAAITQLLTFGLGALAAHGSPMLALGAAVVTAVLLDMRTRLHRWLRLMEQEELSAALQLLVLSLVVLPLLPDEARGPYAALNPYRIWWAVVLVAGLSLSGHVAMRMAGPQRGLLWTGVLGGLASSTAATLALARQARAQPSLKKAALAGIWAACSVMFVRMAIIVGTLAPGLRDVMVVPLLVAALVLAGLAAIIWFHKQDGKSGGMPFDSAFGLATALGFGGVLAAMAILTQAAKDALGVSGLYGLSLLSGTVDVDAIAISVSRMSGESQIPVGVGATAIGCAILMNMVTKAVIACAAGSARLGQEVALGYLASMALGALAFAAVAA